MATMTAQRQTPMDDDDRYRVVVARDKSFDGAFIVAVRTTGVYCRPYCPSRTPKRENVTFYQTPEQARSAGYRACRRCKPDGSAAPDPRLDAVRAACRAIESAEDECPSLETLGTAAGLSPFHLQRSFKAVMGISPRQYWDARRLGKLKRNLKSGEGVAMALYGAGYGSSSRLYEKAGAQLGMTPASYGKGGAGAVIAYAFADTSLGRVIVGATKAGICFVGIGDTDADLVEELRGDFPNATLAADPAGLGETLGEVAGMLEGREPHAGSAARYPRHRVPAPGLAGVDRHPDGRDPDLCGSGGGDRQAQGDPGGGQRLRQQPGLADRALPPGDRHRRHAARLPLGSGPQAPAARHRRA